MNEHNNPISILEVNLEVRTFNQILFNANRNRMVLFIASW